MIHVIMLALFIEAIVSAIKPLWKADGHGMSAAEIVSMGIGLVLAVALKIDLFGKIAGLDVGWNTPAWVAYVFYGMSGIAIGRGPSFVYDLWQALQKWAGSDDKPPDAQV